MELDFEKRYFFLFPIHSFPFFWSLVFELMGCKNGILVFTSLKLHAPIIIKYVFVL